jgi:hypothetical protein
MVYQYDIALWELARELKASSARSFGDERKLTAVWRHADDASLA